MLIFLIFGVFFQMILHKKILNVMKAGFHTLQLILIIYEFLLWSTKWQILRNIHISPLGPRIKQDSCS